MPALGSCNPMSPGERVPAQRLGTPRSPGQCHARNAQPDRRFTCRCEGDGIRSPTNAMMQSLHLAGTTAIL